MFIYLLTHEKELLKKSGTGKLVKKILNDSCSVIKWSRIEPNSIIEKELDVQNTLLIYPTDNKTDDIDISQFENFILIDGTWQEAKKIYNKSPYLKKYQTFKFPINTKSQYNLRRNQKEFGLCTIESVIELHRLKNENNKADILNKEFLHFINKKTSE